MSKESQPDFQGNVVQVLPLSVGNALAAFLDSPVSGPLPKVGTLEINEKVNPPEITVNGTHIDSNPQGARHGDKVVVFTLR